MTFKREKPRIFRNDLGMPYVRTLNSSNHVYCGVRMGGMGIAIGSSIGKQVSEFL